MFDIKKRVSQITTDKFENQKYWTVLKMLSVYCLWMVFDTLFWTISFPYASVQFIGSNIVRLSSAFLICFLIYKIQIILLAKYQGRFLTIIFFIIASLMILSFVDGGLFVINYNLWVNSDEWKISIAGILQQAIYSFFAYTTATGLFYINYYVSVIIKQEKQLKEAEALANEAQLLMLRYQINPHFLFNSLNVIQSMIEKDKSRAKDMVGELGDFFRYTLSKNNQMMVTIKEEVEAISKYLLLQKERFGEKLDLNLSIDPLAEDFSIPFFLIHPLVENAIKYGFSAENKIIRLSLSVELKGKKLFISVVNSGALNNKNSFGLNGNSQSTKTGIGNIKKRLNLFYPGNHEFNLYEKDGYVYAFILINQE